MASFNKVIIIGNLTRDPQLRFLPSQSAVCDFGMATNRRWKKDGEDREEVCFIDVTAFGKQAEVINEHCKKGSALLVEGRLKYDTWEDKQGGGKRSKLSVVLESFQFIGGKQDGEQPASGPRSAYDAAKNRKVDAPDLSKKEFDQDDIPF